MDNVEIDVLEHAERGQEVPHAPAYVVRIDGEKVRVDSVRPTGELLLEKASKRSCAFELIEEFLDGKNNVVEPSEEVDLRKRGLKGFITAHKEIVTIFINGDPYPIDRGNRTVTEILGKVNETLAGYVLLEEKDGPPIPVPTDRPVHIKGCEVFHTQPKSGGSS